jgi:UDP-N-acetylglucosamine 2-epimerase (non-hydrolysing)
MKKVSIIFGTRPELIKLAMLIQNLKAGNDVEVNVCFTGQHKEMVLPLLDFFKIKIDYSLDIMQPNQTLAGLSSRALSALDEYYKTTTPDIVFVQGDTTTAMCAAVAAFYRGHQVAHVEAGLRTNNIYSPFPEEFNRKTISTISDIHFAPTENAKKALLNEGYESSKIFVTGNTVIDALVYTLHHIDSSPNELDNKFLWDQNKRMILITGHRRENFGSAFEDICNAIKELSDEFVEYNFVYPVHLNPNVQEPVNRLLANLPNVFLIPPADYVSFLQLMRAAFIILTDSGGVQEEAPSLQKPILIMRETTERPEVVQCGAAKLVGTNKDDIVAHVRQLINSPFEYEQMASAGNPFGDGKATEKIVTTTLEFLRG